MKDSAMQKINKRERAQGDRRTKIKNKKPRRIQTAKNSFWFNILHLRFSDDSLAKVIRRARSRVIAQLIPSLAGQTFNVSSPSKLFHYFFLYLILMFAISCYTHFCPCHFPKGVDDIIKREHIHHVEIRHYSVGLRNCGEH